MLTNLKTIKHICARHHIKPDKNFGQNFLIDESVLQDIVSAAELQRTDTVIEIGAGIGTLTAALAEKAGRVYGFEVDARLYPVLKETVSQQNVEIVKENILETRARLKDIIEQSKGNYKIVANIPYSITGILVRLFIELVPPPSRVVVMMQKEVAERIIARAGSMSILAAAVQYYAAPKFVRLAPKTAFYPAPKVESAVIAWESRRAYNKDSDEPFFRLVRAGFIHPRKMLKNNLVSAWKDKTDILKIAHALSVAHIPERARPGDLTVDDWLRLSTCLNTLKVVL